MTAISKFRMTCISPPSDIIHGSSISGLASISLAHILARCEPGGGREVFIRITFTVCVILCLKSYLKASWAPSRAHYISDDFVEQWIILVIEGKIDFAELIRREHNQLGNKDA